MSTNSLIVLSMGVTMIAIGLPLLALARYFSAADDKKKHIARGIRVIAIVWVAVGLLIYLLDIIIFRSI